MEANTECAGNEVYKLSSKESYMRFPLEFTVHTDLDTVYQFIDYCCKSDPSHEVYPVTTSLTLKIKRCHPKKPHCRGHLVGYVHFAPLPHAHTLIKFTEDIANDWCEPPPPSAFVPIVEYLLVRLMEHDFIDFAIEGKRVVAVFRDANDQVRQEALSALRRARLSAQRSLAFVLEREAMYGLDSPVRLMHERQYYEKTIAEIDEIVDALSEVSNARLESRMTDHQIDSLD